MLEIFMLVLVLYIGIGCLIDSKITLDKLQKMWYKRINN